MGWDSGNGGNSRFNRRAVTPSPMRVTEFGQPCPCGTQRSYEDCCGRFHTGQQAANTAEELMRSRYAAFCTGHVDYLIATHHPSKRQAGERSSLERICRETNWLELEVVDTANGSATDSEGVVEFIARYAGAQVGVLRERSRFVKQNGQWFYLDGLQDDDQPRGRNEPCWCGSGKKFKKCHGRGRSPL